MRKAWDFGNTTVRNPNRLKGGLKILADEFQGKVHGKEAEAEFINRLDEEGVLNTSGKKSDWFGRKWRSAFVKMGFISNKFNKTFKPSFMTICGELNLEGLDYELTPAGKLLIEANSLGAIEDVFLRQLTQLELKSPTEDNFPEGNMKPFVYLLQVLYELYNKNEKGLSKFEIGAFIQWYRNHTQGEVSKTVEQVLLYRRKRNSIDGKVKKRKFDKETLIKIGKQCKVKGDTLIDYADTTVRYSKMTGLFAYQGRLLVIRENKINVIKAIVKSKMKFISSKDVLNYLKVFYSGAALPTDDPKLAYKEIETLKIRLKENGKTIPTRIKSVDEKSDIKKLEQTRHDLIEINAQVDEEQFAENQANNGSIEEILEYMNAIETGKGRRELEIDEPATYLEWIVWRAFLAIDHITCPIHNTRMFPIDEDLKPRHHAPSRVPDMVFEFEDFVLVVEVTLTTSSRQEAAEGEPVRRHVADVKQSFNNKDVYGFFIAPHIDTNTLETFRKGMWYRSEDLEEVNIVPFSFEQFRELLRALLTTKYTPKDLLCLLDKCLVHRKVGDAIKWKKEINNETSDWLQSLN